MKIEPFCPHPPYNVDAFHQIMAGLPPKVKRMFHAFIDLLIIVLTSLIDTNNISTIRAVLPNYGKLLHMRDIRTGETAMHVAAGYNRLNMLELLRTNNADMSSLDAIGNNLLHAAAHNNSDNVLSWLLLLNKASMNNRNSRGETPLFIAARKGNSGCLQTLLRNGCDINMTNSQGVTPLAISRIKREKALFDGGRRRRFQKIIEELKECPHANREEKMKTW